MELESIEIAVVMPGLFCFLFDTTCLFTAQFGRPSRESEAYAGPQHRHLHPGLGQRFRRVLPAGQLERPAIERPSPDRTKRRCSSKAALCHSTRSNSFHALMLNCTMLLRPLKPIASLGNSCCYNNGAITTRHAAGYKGRGSDIDRVWYATRAKTRCFSRSRYHSNTAGEWQKQYRHHN